MTEPDLRSLVASQPKNHSLVQPFYLSPAIYRRDVAVLMQHWHCVGHDSSIPKPGDWFTFELDTESVIVVRGPDGTVRAHANVCTHRGSRLCNERSGTAKNGTFTCPYHAWVFRTDGTLRNARMMPDSFDTLAHGLRPVPLMVVEGLIFLTFAADPLEFAPLAATFSAALEPHGWSKAKVAAHRMYPISANWKLALENQVECYHCAPSHPDYTRLHAQARPGVDELTAAVNARAAAQGIHFPNLDRWALQADAGAEQDYCRRYAMWEGIDTGSESGKPVAPLMGRYTSYDGGMTLVYGGPVCFFLAYNDYGAIFRYTPRSVNETEMHVTWLVAGDAVEGRDFNLDDVMWLWDVTSKADKTIVEQNQLGVASRYYRPGPYALPIEDNSRRFTEWYLREIAQ